MSCICRPPSVSLEWCIWFDLSVDRWISILITLQTVGSLIANRIMYTAGNVLAQYSYDTPENIDSAGN